MEQFDDEMMSLARQEAKRSPIETRKVGVVISSPSGDVVASACNELFGDLHLPVHIALNDDDSKTFWVEHAERAAIYSAARRGISLTGCSVYSTLFPCASCMRAIIQSGISELVAPAPDYSLQKWSVEFQHSKLLQENSPLRFRPFVAVAV
ncbi:dCMP deaminase [Neorhizobium huautlense]|uniref:dCMP deaminase n=1 Tax=Neorhizobium huautlense TaxID=67774 RepID=A0ABT9PT94_9HYPH|nr:deaminase [Neorhizobium huautlense]MDP9837692.1 dCMP deaminase [Neorhizobium huautlense]